jgi:hypothetical protein
MSLNPSRVLHSIARVSARERLLISALTKGDPPVRDDADKVRALLDAVQVFDAMGAPYALIGGVAVGLHSCVPRAAPDTNLCVRSDRRDATLLDRFRSAGFLFRGEHPHSVNLRHASGEPVQLAFDASFDAMIERADAFDFEGTSIRVVTRKDLIAMKRLAAADPARRRSKALRDQADVELLLGDVPEVDEGW